MFQTCWLKNADTEIHVYHTYGFPVDFSTQILDNDRVALKEWEPLLIDIAAGKMQIGKDGETWLTDINEAINLLKNIGGPKNMDNRPVVHQTPRMLGTYTYFCGIDDDQSDPHAVGGGSNFLEWDHAVDGPNPEVKYMDFNTIYNETHVRQGDVMWKDAVKDTLSFLIVPKVTTYTSGTSTNYNLYEGYLVVPAASDGVVTIADEDRVLIQNVPNEFGNMPAGYWDATWNPSTKQFDSIAPNYTGTGEFNMFTVEVILSKFMNQRMIMGTGKKDCHTDDESRIGHGMRLKIEAHTRGTDHAWCGCATLMLYRKKTV